MENTAVQTTELQSVQQAQVIPINQNSRDVFFDPVLFEHSQRVAKMLSASDMVPQDFKGKISNCMIALNFATRFDIDPIMTMQNMYIIHGRPAIQAQLKIALLNKSGKFSGLKYEYYGSGMDRSCIATARRLSDGEILEGPEVSMKMAQAEGWYHKNGSKWKTLPDLMLSYRAASFFCSVYCPEVALGMMVVDEDTDVKALNQYQKEAPVLDSPEQIFSSEPVKIEHIDDIRKEKEHNKVHDAQEFHPEPHPEKEASVDGPPADPPVPEPRNDVSTTPEPEPVPEKKKQKQESGKQDEFKPQVADSYIEKRMRHFNSLDPGLYMGLIKQLKRPRNVEDLKRFEEAFASYQAD